MVFSGGVSTHHHRPHKMRGHMLGEQEYLGTHRSWSGGLGNVLKSFEGSETFVETANMGSTSTDCKAPLVSGKRIGRNALWNVFSAEKSIACSRTSSNTRNWARP